ncbi:transmembrane protein 273 isoform X2 [Ochotona curzoniae]|uniref:transmembrane protein 273 isoform X2 n=1 Tax=Ochotona curzoniae TaxID=130825 RepID=UPI001B349496|nr:transmembrane protein 273 isoform X2 [Ochotona curzoniae]
MGTGSPMLTTLLFLLDVGSAQVLAAGKSAGTEIDFKYAIIGTAVGVAISAAFLALKICVIRKQLLESDSSDARSAPVGSSDPAAWKKRRSTSCCFLSILGRWQTAGAPG